MIFTRLELKNFACFYGDQIIDLDVTPEKPVIIILGGTGNGKTTIFDAINWALYGEVYEQDLIARRHRKIEDYVAQKALIEALKNNESVLMSCTLYFEHNNIDYYITQELTVKPSKKANEDLLITRLDRTTSLYQITSCGDHNKKEYSTIFLNDTLPSNVKDYFLFDGDRIHQLSSPGSSKEVQDAIYRVVDLELIKNAKIHLAEVATQYRKEANKQSSGDLAEIDANYLSQYEDLEKINKEIENLRNEERSVKDGK